MRILTVQASKRGATTELAQAIALALRGHGFEVDVAKAADRPLPSGYDAVIVGSAIYYGRWHADAVQYVEAFASVLRPLPVWLFSSGPIDDSAFTGAIAPVPQVTRLARDLEVTGHMTFGGKFDPAQAALVDRVWAHGRHGDFRDQSQVEEWVHRIALRLSPTPISVVSAVPQQRAARSRRSTRVPS